MKKIQIQIDDIEFQANFLDTKTADAIYNALPVTGYAQIWGDEIYFDIPVKAELESNAKEEVEIGDLAYWPVGSAFCMFFGKTPVSTGNKPRAYSPVNVFGKIEGNTEVLKTVKSGSQVHVKKL